jgi:ketosteroid isomerase-like protein
MTDNIESIKALYAAFGRGDVGAVLAGFDEQIRWQDAEGFRYADGNPYVGPQAVAEGIFMRIVGDVDNFQVAPASYIAGTDAVVVEGRYTGRMKATGVSIDAQFAHIWRLSGGKVVSFQQYTDTHQWAMAFGQPAHL